VNPAQVMMISISDYVFHAEILHNDIWSYWCYYAGAALHLGLYLPKLHKAV